LTERWRRVTLRASSIIDLHVHRSACRGPFRARRSDATELLLRYLAPAEDLATMRAKRPVKRTYDDKDISSVKQLLDHLMTLERPRHVVVSGRAGHLVVKRGDTDATMTASSTEG